MIFDLNSEPEPASSGGFEAVSVPEMSERVYSGSTQPTVTDRDREVAILYSAVNRSITLIANGISAMPIEVWTNPRKTGEWSHRLPPAETELYSMLDPDYLVDGTNTFSAVINTLICDMLSTGNGFAYIQRDGNRPVGLTVLDPSCVRATNGAAAAGKFGRSYQYVYTGDGMHENIMPDDVLHIRMPQLHARTGSRTMPVGGRAGGGSPTYVSERIFGTSPLISLSRVIKIGLASEDFLLGYFESGLGSTVALIYQTEVEEEQRRRIKEWVKAQANGRDQRAPLIISNGGDIKMIQPDASGGIDEMRKRNLTDVARAFGVPPFLLGEHEVSSWGTGIQEIARGFYRFTLHPLAAQIAAQLSAKLSTGEARFRFDPSDLIRESPRSETEMTLQLIGGNNNPPVISFEEGRRREGYGPVNPNDTFFVPTAFGEGESGDGAKDDQSGREGDEGDG